MSKAERMGSETDLEAIDRVRETHVAALNAGDAEAWAAQHISQTTGCKCLPTRLQTSAGR